VRAAAVPRVCLLARATVDVDVGLRLAGAPLDSLVQQAAAHGLATRIAGWSELADRARVLLLIDQRSGIEEALGRSDLRPVLERLLSRARDR